MRQLSYILFLLFSFSLGLNTLYAQNSRVQVDLNWSERSVLINPQEEIYKSIFSFSDGQLLNGNPNVSIWKTEIPVSGNVELAVTISDIVIEETQYPIDKQGLSEEFSIKTYVNKARDSYMGGLSLTPIRLNGSSVERIKSCVLNIKQTPVNTLVQRGPNRTFSSLLSEGNIFKVAVTKAGVYKLTKSDFSNLGLDVDNIDPKNIGVFSNYGGALPELIADQNPDDLIELPILITGENDGKFDQTDELFFYAEGADKWKIKNNDYQYETNVYDTRNFVYIKVLSQNGKRVVRVSSDIIADFVSDRYDHLEIYNKEALNLLGLNPSTEGSGKVWFGDQLDNGEVMDLSNRFNLTNLATNEIIVTGQFAARSSSSSNTTLTVGGESVNTIYNRVSLGSVESPYANLKQFKLQSDISLNKSITLRYNASAGGNGWIDYIDVRTKKKINLVNGSIILRDIRDATFNTFGYSFENLGENAEMWDVTDLDNIKSFDISIGKVAYDTESRNHEIVLFDRSKTTSPELLGRIENQNLHGIDNVDMVVLYPSIFKEAADKFIAHRSSHSNLVVEGIEVTKIYNEFSSGRQDPSAIRDFAKMLLDRNDRFRYMLFIGDGTYDQRGLLNIPDHRFIPVYETDQSLDPIRAFPTDDYYALLSDNEGLGLDGALDIGVGRLTVTTQEEADAVINKIIQYDTSPQRFGDWKLRASFTADDEDSNTHLEQMDEIASEVVRDYNIINDQKVYFDAYRQETTPGGQRYPDVEDAFKRNMDRGQITFCYLGHGGPKGWAQERVLKVSDIQEWDNIASQTLIISATCSFTGYDDPEVKSAGEYALLNGKGGAVALFTTVRAVYASENKRLTEAVFENIYKKGPDGLPMTFGDAIINAKNTNSQDTVGENSRKFSLIGDPSQRIALPIYDISVDMINDQPSNTFSDTVGSLEVVKVSGRILDENGAQINSFNGTIFPTIFDKRSIIETLGNDSKSKKTKIDVMKNIIFKGKASVRNGAYEFSFVVPKDINYSIGNGKISLYATDNVIDAAGANTNLIIGGSGKSVADDSGPEIDLYINDESFIYGGTVPSNSTLLINLEDDLGINVTGSSIGHDLTGRLEGPISEDFVLNEFYEASLDDYRSGVVKFPLDDLPVGKYTMTVKAWDISNNSSEKMTEFVVVDNEDKLLFNVLNYPNPFSTYTEFGFSHDLGATDAQVTIKIYTVTGKLIRTLTKDVFLSGERQNVSGWDASDDFGSRIARGIYLYKINLYSPSLGISRESKFQKLVKF